MEGDSLFICKWVGMRTNSPRHLLAATAHALALAATALALALALGAATYAGWQLTDTGYPLL